MLILIDFTITNCRGSNGIVNQKQIGGIRKTNNQKVELAYMPIGYILYGKNQYISVYCKTKDPTRYLTEYEDYNPVMVLYILKEFGSPSYTNASIGGYK